MYRAIHVGISNVNKTDLTTA